MPDTPDYGNFNPYGNEAHETLVVVIDEELHHDKSLKTSEVAKKVFARIYGCDYSQGKSASSLKDEKHDGNTHELADHPKGKWGWNTLRYNLIPYALQYMDDSGMAEHSTKKEGGEETKYWKLKDL
jgi:hypothetical protein